MSPAIEHGDQVVVNPAIPPRPGCDCVFIHDDGDGQMRALVKRLVKSNADSWRVKQFNPAKEFDLPKRRWPKAMMITEKRYG
jgi:phage repressor protein C with HTH and peptisase S24 domain